MRGNHLAYAVTQGSGRINLDDDKYRPREHGAFYKVWTEMKTTWKHSVCVPYMDNFTNGYR